MRKVIPRWKVTPALIVVLAAAAASPGRQSGSRSSGEVSAAVSTVSSLDEIKLLERECFDEVNKYRKLHRVAALELDGEVLGLAREYSRKMADERFFSHTDAEGKTVRERLAKAGIRWRYVGENIASSRGYFSPVAAAMHGWLGSPGHLRNILDPRFTSAAVGAWIASDGSVYFTQVFISK